jgi:hypothetical protein
MVPHRQGGGGSVYKALDIAANRTVALTWPSGRNYRSPRGLDVVKVAQGGEWEPLNKRQARIDHLHVHFDE